MLKWVELFKKNKARLDDANRMNEVCTAFDN